MNKTDPRIIKTLRQIDTALLENLQERPFQKITIDMLCKSALINRSTFYKYYKDKYDLMDRYVGRVLAEFRQAMDSTDFILASPSNIDDPLYMDNFRSSLEFIHAKRAAYQVLWNANIETQIYVEMIDIIRSNILAKLKANPQYQQGSEHYQDLYAFLFASNMMSLVRWWFKNEHIVTADDVCRLMNSNMKNGLFATFKHCN